ncbi:MAG: Ig-like domain-containing protein [Rhodocyclaceae bacterium]|nr:Ig-like domain-containing protein [Rhodocyclaceae bacterium]
MPYALPQTYSLLGGNTVTSAIATRTDDYAASIVTGGRLSLGGSATGNLESFGDRDWFAITLTAGRTVQFDLRGSSVGQGTLRDPYLWLLGSNGAVIVGNDDGGGSLNSRIVYTPSVSGTFYLSAAAYGDGYTGTYTLTARDYDVTSPTLLSSNPADSATGVAVGANIVLNFSEAVRAGTGTVTLTNLDTGGVQTISAGDTTQISFSGSTMTINPSGDLAAGRRYAVTVSSTAVFDLANNPYAGLGSGALDFTTQYTDDYAGSPATAGRLAVGAAVTGNIEVRGDRDWFAVTLAAGQTVQFDLQGAGSAQGTLADPYLRLFNSAGTQLATNDDGGSFLNSRLAFTPTSAGTYYVAAGSYLDSIMGTYRLSASSVDATAPILQSASPADGATGVAVGANIVLSFNEAVQAGPGTITVTDLDTGANTLISARDTAQVSISGSTLTINPIADLAAGHHYGVSVSNSAIFDLAGNAYGGFGSSALDFTTSYPDDYAASPATAGRLAVGASVTGNIEQMRDRDWFAITLTAGQSVQFDLQGAGTAQGTLRDPFLRVYNASGTELAGNDDGGSNLNSRIVFTASGAGTYFVCAGAFGDALTGTYRLSAGVADAIAPTLVSISPADGATGVAVGTNISLTFSESVRAGSGQIMLTNLDTLASRTISVTDTSQVTFSGNTMVINPSADLTAGGHYTVSIVNGVVQDAAGNSYAGLGYGNYDFTTLSTDDYAASASTTGRLTVGGSATGNIETANDQDWFAVTLTAGQSVQIDQQGAGTGQGTLADSFLRLYNSSGTLIASNDDGGSNFNSRIMYTPTSTGTYYVAAGGFSTQTGTYRVSVGSVDSAAPRLLSSSPADGAAGVAPGANIVLNFSENVRVGAGNFTLTNLDTGTALNIAVTDTSQVTISGSTLTINPASDLTAGRRYALTVGQGVVLDASGNTYAGLPAGALDFTTATPGDDYAGTTATSGRLSVGGSVTGSIETRGDQDWFAVSLNAGQTVQLELQGAGSSQGTLADPYMRLLSSSGSVLATNDNGGGAPYDAHITYTAATAGTYFVSAEAAGGTYTGTYRLSAGGDDFLATTATTGQVSVGGSATGRVEVAGDQDWFAVTLNAGTSYTIREFAASGQTLADTFIRGIYNSAGVLQANTINDDADGSLSSRVTFAPSVSGTYYIAASGYGSDTGTYSVSVASQSNLAPQVTATIQNQIAPEGQAFAYRMPWNVFTDPEGQQLSFRATLADGTALPSWLSFDPAAQIFTGTPGAGAGDITVRLTATDPGADLNPATAADNLSVSTTFTISTPAAADDYAASYLTTGSVAPGASASGNIETANDQDWFRATLTAGQTYVINLRGISGTGSLPDTYLRGIYSYNPATNATTLMSGTSNDDYGGSLYSQVSFTPSTTGSYFIAAGGYGNNIGRYTLSVSGGSTGTTGNHAPTVNAGIPDQTATEGSAWTYTVPTNAFTDLDTGSNGTLTYSATLADNSALPAWLTFNPSTRTFSGTPPAGSNDLSVLVTARDGGGLSVSDGFTLNTPAPGTSNGSGTWTVMVYLAADNSLDAFSLRDINEMESLNLPSNVNIVIELDRAGSNNTYRGRVQHDNNTTAIGGYTSISEINSGDPASLRDFINWSASNYRADHYALVVWDHGGGLAGTSWDDSSFGANLSIAECTSAISDSVLGTNGFDVIGFDTCLQGMVEQAYDLRNLADYVVASQDLEPGDGWDYAGWLQSLANNPNTSARDLAISAVNSYGAYYNHGETLAAVQTSSLTGLRDAINAFSDATVNATSAQWTALRSARSGVTDYNYASYLDLAAYMDNVAASATLAGTIATRAAAVSTALRQAVVATTAVGGVGNLGMDDNGLSIYLPTSLQSATAADYSANNLAFVADSRWRTYLTNLASH